MRELRKLLHFIKPYSGLAAMALILLTFVLAIDLSIPRLIQTIIDQGVKQKDMTVVVHTSILALVLALLQFAIAMGNNITSIRVGEGISRDLREALFNKIQSFSYGNMDYFTTGKLMVRLTSDSTAVQRVFQVSLRIGTRAPLMMVGSLILMFNTNQALALSLLPLLIFTAVVIVYFSTKMEPLFLSVQQKLDRLNTVLQENIAGARLVKAFVRADFETARFQTANTDFTERNVDVMTFMSTLSPALTFLLNIGMVAVIYWGGLRTIQGTMTDGQIIAFTNYLSTTMGPLLMMTMLANTWANGIASARRVNEVLDTQPDVQDAPNAAPLPSGAAPRVTFNEVSFAYRGSSTRVLEQVSFAAAPGQTIAILGATGAGKTTLVEMIPRFYDPTAGQITIDGHDIRALDQDSLLAHIAIVPQETILFSGTVAENIAYGKPDATQEEIIAAAQAAQAHDFITRLSEGYQTHIEERGVNLSGGQKQRIAIARAIILQPKILILDDSTSAVDVETETKIQDALARHTQPRTTIIVAQRISTVLKADTILVLDKGRITAQGPHSELIRTSPIYQEIYDSQLGSGFKADMAEESLTERAV